MSAEAKTLAASTSAVSTLVRAPGTTGPEKLTAELYDGEALRGEDGPLVKLRLPDGEWVMEVKSLEYVLAWVREKVALADDPVRTDREIREQMGLGEGS